MHSVHRANLCCISSMGTLCVGTLCVIQNRDGPGTRPRPKTFAQEPWVVGAAVFFATAARMACLTCAGVLPLVSTTTSKALRSW